MVMVTFYNAYYCIIVGWSLYYFIASFTAIPDLPWNTCEGWWNTQNCSILSQDGNHTISPGFLPNETIASVEEFWR